MKTILLLVFYFVAIVGPPVLLIWSGVWVYHDAKKFKDKGIKILNPNSWCALVIVVWIIFFPLYLILRHFCYDKQSMSSQPLRTNDK